MRAKNRNHYLVKKFMSKIFFYKILSTLFLLSLFTFGQQSKPQDSVKIQIKEVESIFKDVLNNPLQPVETRSPRATLESFIKNMYRAYQVVMLAYRENQSSGGLTTPDSIENMAEDRQ